MPVTRDVQRAFTRKLAVLPCRIFNGVHLTVDASIPMTGDYTHELAHVIVLSRIPRVARLRVETFQCPCRFNQLGVLLLCPVSRKQNRDGQPLLRDTLEPKWAS